MRFLRSIYEYNLELQQAPLIFVGIRIRAAKRKSAVVKALRNKQCDREDYSMFDNDGKSTGRTNHLTILFLRQRKLFYKIMFLLQKFCRKKEGEGGNRTNNLFGQGERAKKLKNPNWKKLWRVPPFDDAPYCANGSVES